ncbi:MAG TPA: maleylpyruvate isomerase family mycothiol-dependent enzyme [Micromonosporaceae bacterium]
MVDQGTRRWAYQDYCEAVETEVGRFLDAVRDVDPATPVPTCPGWTMGDLVKHHGMSINRVEHVVRHYSPEPVWSKDVPATLPDHAKDYPAWLASLVKPLITTLGAADPDTPMWTNGADRHARYWARRLLFEAVVHRADAEIALGRAPVIDGATAADGIDELLTNLPCFTWVAERQRQLRRDGQTLHLHATDRVAEWLIMLGPDGFAWRPAHDRAHVTVEAGAGDLLLLVYGRLAPTDQRFAVTGDRALLREWLEKSAL